MKESEFLSMAQAARFALVSVSQLYKDCHRRVIPYYKLGRRNWIKKGDLLAYIETKRIASVDELHSRAEQQFAATHHLTTSKNKGC